VIAVRPAGFAVAVLALTAAVLVVAARPLRSRRLAALAAVSLLASAAAVETFSDLPVKSTGRSTLNYLTIPMLAVSVLTWLAVGSAVVLAGRQVISRRRPLPAAPGDHGSGPGKAAGTRAGWAVRAVGFAAAALIALAASLAIAQQGPTADARLGSLAGLASRQIERALPGQPIALSVAASSVRAQRRLTLGIVWALRASGYLPEVGGSAELGPVYIFRGQRVPRVMVHVRGNTVSVNVTTAPADLDE